MSIFDELKKSLEEAVEIKQESKETSRGTRYENTDIQAIYTSVNISQSEFSQALCTSVDTIKSSES